MSAEDERILHRVPCWFSDERAIEMGTPADLDVRCPVEQREVWSGPGIVDLVVTDTSSGEELMRVACSVTNLAHFAGKANTAAWERLPAAMVAAAAAPRGRPRRSTDPPEPWRVRRRGTTGVVDVSFSRLRRVSLSVSDWIDVASEAVREGLRQVRAANQRVSTRRGRLRLATQVLTGKAPEGAWEAARRGPT